MDVEDILKQILGIYAKKSLEKKYSEGFIVPIYPDKFVKLIHNNKEILIEKNRKCLINHVEFLKSSDDEFVEIIIKIDGIKEKVKIKKKFIKIKHFTLSKL